MNNRKPAKYILIIMLLLVAVSYFSKVSYAAQCSPGECNPSASPPEYECQGSTMCCTGGGCPSYACEAAGCSPEIIGGDWQCCYSDEFSPTTSAQCQNIEDTGGWDSCFFDDPDCLCYNCGGSCGDPINPDPDDSCEYCTGGGNGDPECSGTPEAAVLVSPQSPANGSTIGSQTVNYDWNGIGYWGDDCEDRDYRVYVYSDAALTNQVIDSGNLGEDSDTLWTKTGLDSGSFVDGATYYWRVRTSNEDSDAWSSTWSFTYNTTPSPICDFLTGPTSIPEGVASTWTLNASDPEGTVNRIDAYRRKFDPSGTDYSWGSFIDASWTLEEQQNPSCGGSSCNFNTISWTPASGTAGIHWLVANVWDYTQGDQCSGTPLFTDPPYNAPGYEINGFKDCTTTCRMQVTVEDHTPPVCNASYGAQQVSLNTYYNYNAESTDGEHDTTGYNWTTTCNATRPTITNVLVRARGTNYNGWPIMNLYVSNSGLVNSASPDCVRTISSGSYQDYSCQIIPGKIGSTVDVVFTNDAYNPGPPVQNRDMFVDYIELTMSDGVTTEVRRIESESNNTLGDKVHYDIGGLPNGPFDGFDAWLGTEGVADGTQTMGWSGALRFPIPVKFNAAQTCSITATPRDPYDTAATGCVKNITACGSAPAAPTGPVNPPLNAQDVAINPQINLQWNHSGVWGNTCGAQNNGFTVRAYAKTNKTDACLPQGSASYGSYVHPTDDTLTNLTLAYFSQPDKAYCWYVTASNSEYGTSSSPTWEYETENPVLDQNWVTSIGAGAFANNITIELPEYPTYTAPAGNNFQYPYLAYRFTSSPIAFPPFYTNGDPAITATGYSYDQRSQPATQPGPGMYAENLDPTGTTSIPWPESYEDLAVPTNAIDLDEEFSGNCEDIFDNASNLDTNEVYKISVECMNDAIADAASNTYKLTDVGTSVIYVEADPGPVLTIDQNFLAQGGATGDGLVIISQAPVYIDNNFGLAGNPTLTSSPNIQATIIGLYGIIFGGTADASTTPDTTIFVEGSLITSPSETIHFDRNRGIGNAYPSEIVKYTSKYLYDLTSNERTASEYNKSGLFTTDIVYEIDN